jgi:cystathionine beta-synthase
MITHLAGVGTGGDLASRAPEGARRRSRSGDRHRQSVFKTQETGVFTRTRSTRISLRDRRGFLPKNVDFDLIVTSRRSPEIGDHDAADRARRDLRRQLGRVGDGLPQLREHFTDADVIVVIFHDPGRAILGRFQRRLDMSAASSRRPGWPPAIWWRCGCRGAVLESEEPVEHAVRLMSEHDFSQISITRDNRLVGSLNETHLYDELVKNAEVKAQPVESIMQPAFPFVDVSTPVDLLSTMITPQSPAVLVRDFKTDKTFIITRSDLIRVL